MPDATLAKRSRLASKRHSFLLGFGQMILVSVNIKNIANGNVVWAAAFTIINTFYLQYVTRTYIHMTFEERIANALGAAVGVVVGIAIHYYALKPIAFTQLATIAHR